MKLRPDFNSYACVWVMLCGFLWRPLINQRPATLMEPLIVITEVLSSLKVSQQLSNDLTKQCQRGTGLTIYFNRRSPTSKELQHS